MEPKEKLSKLDELFGSYKAEWLRGKIFELYSEPFYLSKLENSRPFILQGGRGTGKTTVLRGLSYQGRFAINGNNVEKNDKVPFIGIYYRVNTNHVHTFSGKGIDEEVWMRLFAHYFNLIICYEIVKFLKWHKELSPMDEDLSVRSCSIVASALCISTKEHGISSFVEFAEMLQNALLDFQVAVNNIADKQYPQLSMPGEPIKLLTEQVELLSQFNNKIFYILIDEYENLLDNQQQIVNTLIKHTPDSYTFKIGVREMGWRVKYTMNRQELLNDPADYELYKIEEQFSDETDNKFREFAKDVCQKRIQEIFENSKTKIDIEKVLSSYSIEEESEILKVRQHPYYQRIVDYEQQNNLRLEIPSLYKFLIGYWSETYALSTRDIIEDYRSNPTKWNGRYDNYKYSMLFKIKTGRGSGGVQKYFAGWNTFVKLANGNIRYLMELVYQSYYLMLQKDEISIDMSISPEIQTMAAYNVGRKNLTELEGAWNKGVQLTKLVQTLGTLFHHLAQDGKAAPEIVQFEFSDDMSDRTREILAAAVMNLAIVRMPSNKLQSRTSLKTFQYSLHPIFAPYFIYSFRRKRKMVLTDQDFLGCIDNPIEKIKELLGRKNISLSPEDTLDTQLSLFENND